LYQKLHDFREDHDKTQSDIAALLRVSQTTYSRYESGVLDIPSVSLIQLAIITRSAWITFSAGLTRKSESAAEHQARELRIVFFGCPNAQKESGRVVELSSILMITAGRMTVPPTNSYLILI